MAAHSLTILREFKGKQLPELAKGMQAAEVMFHAMGHAGGADELLAVYTPLGDGTTLYTVLEKLINQYEKLAPLIDALIESSTKEWERLGQPTKHEDWVARWSELYKKENGED